MDLRTLVRQEYVTRALLTRRSVLATRKAWRQLDPHAIRATWHGQVGPAVERMLIGAQAEAASLADAYVTATLRAQGIDDETSGSIVPEGFAGTASDGRDLTTLLELSNMYALQQIQAGATAAQGLAVGGQWLAQTVGLQVLDAGRAANSVAIAARPRVSGYIRVTNGACCARCAVLADRWYRWNADFARHPNCQCGQVAADDESSASLRSDPMQMFRDGEITGLSVADTTAIEDGADISQVINAHRGMFTAQMYGRDLKITTEGMTTRGYAASQMNSAFQKVAGERYRRNVAPRLMPESIYKLANGDRAEALRLLRRFGYIV